MQDWSGPLEESEVVDGSWKDVCNGAALKLDEIRQATRTRRAGERHT